jgi:hypothetical protein
MTIVFDPGVIGTALFQKDGSRTTVQSKDPDTQPNPTITTNPQTAHPGLPKTAAPEPAGT